MTASHLHRIVAVDTKGVVEAQWTPGITAEIQFVGGPAVLSGEGLLLV